MAPCRPLLPARPGLVVCPVLSLSQKLGVGKFLLGWSGLMLDLCSLCREAAPHQTTPVRLPGDQPAPTSDPHPWRGWRLYPPLLLRRSSLPLSPAGAISRARSSSHLAYSLWRPLCAQALFSFLKPRPCPFPVLPPPPKTLSLTLGLTLAPHPSGCHVRFTPVRLLWWVWQ